MYDSNRLIFLGPPGAGKGTQAIRLSMHLGIPQISTGDILRDEIKANSVIGQKAKTFMDNGLLVSDEIVIQIVKNRLQNPDCNFGFILDGFPRTLGQATSLNLNGITIDTVYVFESKTEVLIQRITGRRICTICHKMYHVQLNPPQIPGQCDDCNSILIQRPDDQEATVLRRVDVYETDTIPIIDFYSKLNHTVIVRFNAGEDLFESPDVIFQRLLQAGH